jgi:hypothetical protein
MFLYDARLNFATHFFRTDPDDFEAIKVQSQVDAHTVWLAMRCAK